VKRGIVEAKLVHGALTRLKFGGRRIQKAVLLARIHDDCAPVPFEPKI